MTQNDLSRRALLRSAIASAGAGVAAVTAAEGREDAKPAPASPYSGYLVEVDKGNEVEAATEDNIEGPFYRPGAPFRETLFDAGEPGTVLRVSGKVVARNGRPLAGVLIEVWQASAAGRYDNDDPDHPPAADQFHLRARLKSDRAGGYEFTTVRPAPYTIGRGQFRPAHIHLKIHQDGYKALTTQLYFRGDKYNKADPWYKPSLALDPKPDGDRLAATFKIVLARV